MSSTTCSKKISVVEHDIVAAFENGKHATVVRKINGDGVSIATYNNAIRQWCSA